MKINIIIKKPTNNLANILKNEILFKLTFLCLKNNNR